MGPNDIKITAYSRFKRCPTFKNNYGFTFSYGNLLWRIKIQKKSKQEEPLRARKYSGKTLVNLYDCDIFA